MSDLNQDDVLFILKLLEESSFDELHLQTDHFTLQAKKHPRDGKQPELDFEYEIHAPPVEGDATESQSRDLQSPKASSLQPRSPLAVPEGLLAIRAPMLGIFYRTPQPGAPPFVEVGTWVTEDDPVCIIEVMKLTRTVSAGIRGRIVQICAEQDEMVELNQILFLAEPASEEEEAGRQ